jgi:hypothetical protein
VLLLLLLLLLQQVPPPWAQSAQQQPQRHSEGRQNGATLSLAHTRSDENSAVSDQERR